MGEQEFVKPRQSCGALLLLAFCVAESKPAREMRLPPAASGYVTVTRRIVYAGDKLFLFQLERANQPKLRARNQGSSFQLWLYPFIANTDAPLPSVSYTSPTELNEVYRLANDRIVARLDESVAVFSPEGKVIFTERVPRLTDRYSEASVWVSPDGQRFLISYRDRRSDPLRIRQFDATTLKPTAAMRLEGDQEPIAATSGSLLFRRRNTSLGVFELWLQPIAESPPRLLYRFKREECIPTAAFVSDNTVATLSCETLRFLELSGKAVASLKTGVPGALGDAQVNSDAHRVAFQILKSQPVRYLFGPLLGEVEGQQIMVWDRSSTSIRFRISLGKQHGREPDFAFSPAGNEVAILEGDTIKIYSVNHE